MGTALAKGLPQISLDLRSDHEVRHGFRRPGFTNFGDVPPKAEDNRCLLEGKFNAKTVATWVLTAVPIEKLEAQPATRTLGDCPPRRVAMPLGRTTRQHVQVDLRFGSAADVFNTLFSSLSGSFESKISEATAL